MGMATRKTKGDFTDAISDDTLDGVLADSHRRIVLEVLAVHDRKLLVSDLAVEICARKTENAIPSWEQMTAVARSLHHRDLHALDQHRLIAYDSERGTVEPGEAIDQVTASLSQNAVIGKREEDDTAF